MEGNRSRYGTVRSFIHSPISGRLSTISMRLPTHMQATRPQKSCGLSVMACGPGSMPWIIMAPSISAITPLEREAEGQHRDEGGLGVGVVGGSGAATPSIAPLPNCEPRG